MATQEEAKTAIGNGGNCLITGGAGRGKSYLMNQTNTNDSIICAPTGVAALNVGGDTAHALFGLPTSLVTEADKQMIPTKTRNLFKPGSGVNRLRIDEIGMMRADYLDLIDHKLRMIRGNNEAFGGIQVIGSGDFYQLEPVVARNEKKHFGYPSPFCFDSAAFHDAGFNVFELTKNYRQEKPEQTDILDAVRRNTKAAKDALEAVNDLATPADRRSDDLHLTCYKNDAETINRRHYNRIKGDEYCYTAEMTGKFIERPVEDTINLKVGCKVLICANDVIEGTYKNGERGEVLECTPDYVLVLKEDGFQVAVTQTKWTKFGYTTKNGFLEKEVRASFKQMPLRLGYGVTIHKLQGATLDRYVLDLGKGTFGHGQLYVGLSRITDLSNLMLNRYVTPFDLIVNPRVTDFYKRIGA